jgi:hypothetical protein
VKRIRVRGKRGPVELYALIFATNTIIPQAILPTLPKVTFELVPEEPKQPDAKASVSKKRSEVEEPGIETATEIHPQNAIGARQLSDGQGNNEYKTIEEFLPEAAE